MALLLLLLFHLQKLIAVYKLRCIVLLAEQKGMNSKLG